MTRFCTTLLALLLPFAVFSAGTSRFPENERFRFQIKVFGIVVGYQDMMLKGYQTIAGQKLLYAVADTKSLPEIQSTFNYSLHDVIHVWMDPETLLPVLIKKDIQEGRWLDKITIEMDQTAKTAIYYDKRLPGGKRYTLPGPTLDLLSIIYYIRSLALKAGDRVTMHYFDEKKGVLKTDIAVTQDRPLKAGNRLIPTLLYTQKSGHGVRVRVTGDRMRIPLSITVATFEVYGYKIDIVGTLVPLK